MKRKEDSNTPHHNKKQTKEKNGNIESSFEKLLKWRESEHLRVLNLTEQCGAINGHDKLQLDIEDMKSKVDQTRQCIKIAVIKQ